MKSMHASQIKEHHYQLVKNILRTKGSATKSELAQATGLSVVTIGNLLQELEQEGAVRAGGLVPSGGGRPSQCYEFQYRHQMVCAVKVLLCGGKSRLTLTVADLRADVLYEKEHTFPDLREEDVLNEAAAVCRQFPQIAAVQFGAFGHCNDQTLYLCDYLFLQQPEFLQKLQTACGRPVEFCNLCGAAVLGSCKRLGLETADAVQGYYFSADREPCAGTVWHDRVVSGHHGFAGEISPLHPDWKSLDYSSTTDVCAAMELLLTISCCLFAPKQIVLYGNFWTDELLDRLHDYCSEMLYFQFEPHFIACTSFDTDSTLGLLHLALDQLEPEHG